MNRNIGGIGTEGIYRNSFLTSSKNLFFGVCTFILVLVTTGHAIASGGGNRGTKPLCLGGSFAAVAGDVWSLYYNPAGLALVEGFQSAVFFMPQQFGLTELRTVSFAIAFPVFGTRLGMGVEQFGFDLYRETSLSVAVGRRIGENICGGVVVHYDQLAIRRYGSTRLLLVDTGIGAEPFEDCMIGFCLRNVTGARIGERKQRLPRSVMLGAGCRPFRDFLVTFEIEKDVRYPAMLRAGIEQRVLEFVALRCGISTRPDMIALGLALTYAEVEFGYAASSHPDLGWTQSVEMKFRLEP